MGLFLPSCNDAVVLIINCNTSLYKEYMIAALAVVHKQKAQHPEVTELGGGSNT